MSKLVRGMVFVAAAVGAFSAGSARGADECNGLRVCLPVAGPWVVLEAGVAEYELACPLPGYVVAGTDARVAAPDVDVSFRGETGSPVGPGVTTRSGVVFRAERTSTITRVASFQPFIGCIPSSGGGGRALTGVKARAAGIKPEQVVTSVVVNARVGRGTKTLRAACPSRSRLVASTHAAAFRQLPIPTGAQLRALRVRRSVVDGVVVARVTASRAAGPNAEVQLRAVCGRVP